LAAIIALVEGQMRVLRLSEGLVAAKWLEAKARHLAARALGEEPDVAAADRPLTVGESLQDRSVNGAALRSLSTNFGKKLKARYRDQYGHDPATVERFVDGALRRVAGYTESTARCSTRPGPHSRPAHRRSTHMSDGLVAWIRSVTPIAVGVTVTWLATRLHIIIDTDTSAAITTGITGVTTAAYYTLIRRAETRWPAVGWLLGAAKTPTYTDPSEVVHVNGVMRQTGG
jgi:hypothetical protein